MINDYPTLITRDQLLKLAIDLRSVEAVIDLDMKGCDPGVGRIFPIALSHAELRSMIALLLDTKCSSPDCRMRDATNLSKIADLESKLSTIKEALKK